MIPIIMLRPPRTKLVICKRGEYRDDIMYVQSIFNGEVNKLDSEFIELLEMARLYAVL